MRQIILTLFLFVSTLLAAQNTSIVLKTNFKGEVSEGSIEKLISNINEGKKVRIGWQLDFDKDGKSDLDHWIDADFLSVLNGHVFNQITPIYRQVPKKDIPQVNILQSDMKWTAIIGTNGKLISRYIVPNIESIEDELARNKMIAITAIKERIVATTWVILE